MKVIGTLLTIILSFNFSFAQYVPPVIGQENMAIYCASYDYLATADTVFYSIAPGETKELKIDLRSFCPLYVRNDVTLEVGVSFRDDPLWRKGKDQIALQGLSHEVIDAETGQNLVNLVKSQSGQACNWGSGFVFSDLTILPATLRPVIVRLKNNGRTKKEAAWTLRYQNQTSPSLCADYPRSR